MPVVSIQRTNQDDYDGIKAAIDRVIDQLGGLEDIVSPGSSVMIKPNMVACPSQRLSGCVTRWEVCFAICEAVQAVGGKPFIAESSAVGSDTEAVIEKCGYQTLREKGIPVIDLKAKENSICRVNVPNGVVFKEIDTWELVLNTDVIITVPVMKTHDQTEITLGMKNLKGLLRDTQKRDFHRKGLVEGVVDWCAFLKPALEIVDGTYCQEGMGPIFGETKAMHLLVGSKDLVACEAVAGKLMGYEPEEVMITKMAYTRGLGEMDLEHIETVGVQVSEAASRFKRSSEVQIEGIPESFRLIFSQDTCTGCRNTVISALVMMRHRGILHLLEGKNICAGSCGKENLPEDACGKNTICVGICCKKLADEMGFRCVIGCSPGNDDVIKEIRNCWPN